MCSDPYFEISQFDVQEKLAATHTIIATIHSTLHTHTPHTPLTHSTHLSHSLFGIRIARVRVENITPAVIAMKRDCGMGGATANCPSLSGHSSEFMLTRHGNTIRGKLNITVTANPGVYIRTESG